MGSPKKNNISNELVAAYAQVLTKADAERAEIAAREEEYRKANAPKTREQLQGIIDTQTAKIDSIRNTNKDKWDKERAQTMSAFGGSMFAPASQNYVAATSKEQKQLEAAQLELKNARKALDTYTESDQKRDIAEGKEKSWYTELWDGLTNTNINELADIATFDMHSSGNKAKINRAMEKKSKGEEVSEIEQTMIDALSTTRQSEKYVAENGGGTAWNSIGDGVRQSAGFMIRTGLSGGSLGITRELVSKGAWKTAATMLGREALRSPIYTMVSDFQNRTADQYSIGMDGSVEMDNVTSLAERLWKSYATSAVEGISEQIGSFIPGGFVGKGLRKVAPKLLGSKIGGAVEKGVDYAAKKTQGLRDTFQKVTNYNGTIDEYLEEQFNNIVEPILTGETERIKDNFSAKQQWITLGSVAVMGGAMHSVSLPSIARDEIRAGSLRSRRNESIKNIENETMRQGVFDAIKKGVTVEDRAKMMASLDWAGASQTDAASAVDAYTWSTRLDLFRGFDEAQRTQELTAQKVAIYNDTFLQNKHEQTGMRHEVADNDGNGYFLLSGSLDEQTPDGTVFVRNMITGKTEQKTSTLLSPISTPTTYENGLQQLSEQISTQTNAEISRNDMAESDDDAVESNVTPVSYKQGDNVTLSDGRTAQFINYVEDGTGTVQIAIMDEDTGDYESLDVDRSDIMGLASQDGDDGTPSGVAFSQSEGQVTAIESVSEPTQSPTREIPLRKDGQPDYDAMPADMFLEEYSKVVPREEALADLQDIHDDLQKSINRIKSSKVTSLNKKADNRAKTAELQAKMDQIASVLEANTPQQELPVAESTPMSDISAEQGVAEQAVQEPQPSAATTDTPIGSAMVEIQPEQNEVAALPTPEVQKAETRPAIIKEIGRLNAIAPMIVVRDPSALADMYREHLSDEELTKFVEFTSTENNPAVYLSNIDQVVVFHGRIKNVAHLQQSWLHETIHAANSKLFTETELVEFFDAHDIDFFTNLVDETDIESYYDALNIGDIGDINGAKAHVVDEAIAYYSRKFVTKTKFEPLLNGTLDEKIVVSELSKLAYHSFNNRNNTNNGIRLQQIILSGIRTGEVLGSTNSRGVEDIRDANPETINPVGGSERGGGEREYERDRSEAVPGVNTSGTPDAGLVEGKNKQSIEGQAATTQGVARERDVLVESPEDTRDNTLIQTQDENETTKHSDRGVSDTDGAIIPDLAGRERMGTTSGGIPIGESQGISQRESGHVVRSGLRDEFSDGSRSDRGRDSGTTTSVPVKRGRGIRLGQRPDSGSVARNETSHKRNERNFRIDDTSAELVPKGEIAKIKANIEAIQLLKKLQTSSMEATKEDKAILSKYSGWGGLSTVLDRNRALGSAWEVKYKKYHDTLRELLSPEEFTAAVNSTINAHYTTPEIISSIWKAVERLGFNGGTVLEPAIGTGNFFGVMPQGISDVSKLVGYELDTITGGIAQLLYPDANIKVAGYETSNERNGSIDLVISNVPFGKTAPYDPKNKDISSFSLHNYFIAKGLRQLKDGGLGVFVTSSSTMDGRSSSAFRRWSETDGAADFLGAIRLPNTAFESNAGTTVTTDILFYRKRNGLTVSNNKQQYENLTTIREVAHETKWNNKTRQHEDVIIPLKINEYFAQNPQMMLGEMKFAFEIGKGGLYSDTDQTLQANKDTNLSSDLARAIDELPQNVYGTHSDIEQLNVIQANQDDIVSTYVKRDGKSYEVGDDGLIPVSGNVTIKGKKVEKSDIISAFVDIKELAKELVRMEQTTFDDAPAEKLRKQLNDAYDIFVKKYGTLNRNIAIDFLQDDIQHTIPYSLENINTRYEKSKNGRDVKKYDITKADILSRRINRPTQLPTHVESADEAIRLSIRHCGGVDMEFVAQMLNTDIETAETELLDQGIALINPVSGKIEPRSEYLSGYVKDKLSIAKQYAANDPRFENNVRELEKVIPKDIAPSDVNFRFGSYWIPSQYIEQFYNEQFGVRATVNYIETLGEWVVDNGWSSKDGTTRGYQNSDLATKQLNQRQVVVYDKIGERNVKNIEATAEVAAKMSEINDAFIEYIQGREDALLDIAQIFNAKFNNYVGREYENNSGIFPGANPQIKLRPHQSNAVQRILNDSVLLAHEVGTGKTFTMITGAMEMRRLGIARKPMIVVQNSTLEQFAASFQQLYPSAKLLVPSEKQRSANGRQRLFAMIAYGDFDAVIIPQSFIDFIEDDPKRVESKLQKELDTINDMHDSTTDYSMRKELNKQKKRLELEIEKSSTPKVKDIARKQLSTEKKFKQKADRRTDKTFTFEELGIDALFVDEAHAYKKLGFNTNMGNVKGIDTGVSKRAFSMKMKTDWIQERTGGRNVVFATGTPITNTMAEAWTMMRFVSPDVLRRYGIENFDAFASTFGVVETSFEFNAAGNFKQVERFKSFMNAPEFIRLFKSKTDVVLSRDIPGFAEQLPKLKDGAFTNVIVKRSRQLIELMDMIKHELTRWADQPVKERNPAVPLVMFTRASQAAIDLRLVDPNAVDDPMSKANAVVGNVKRIYDETKPYNGTQMIFVDRYQSPDYVAISDNYSIYKNPQTSKRFNLYEDMKDKLVAMGVPESEIAIVTEMDAKRKEQLFDKMNNGDVRIVIGSTERMGVGVNAQRLMAAVHHVDAPARPMDFTQRNGRIIRQGNTHAQMKKDVQVLTYGVEKTLDVTAYQRLAFKQAFIEQILRGDIDSRIIEDAADEGSLSGQSFEEMMGSLSGSQYAMRLTDLKAQLRKAEMGSKNYERSRSELRMQIHSLSSRVAPLQMAVEKKQNAANVAHQLFPEGKVNNINIAGVKHTEKMGDALNKLFDEFAKKYTQNRNTEALRIGINDNPTPAIVLYDPHNERYSYIMRIGEDEIKGECTTGSGLLTSIASRIKNLYADVAHIEAELRDVQNALPSFEKRLNEPNKSADKIEALKAEIDTVTELIAKESKAEEDRIAKELQDEAHKDTDVRFRQTQQDEELERIKSNATAKGDFMQAPNGEPTNLTERQWLQVRTKAFKEWFGDWEKAARIEKLRNAESVSITGKEIESSDDLKEYRHNALEYGKTLRGTYVNKDTGETISLSGGSKIGGLKEILAHDYKDVEHLQSIAAIPKVIESAIFITSINNENQSNKDIESYDYYVCGLNIGGVNYTIKAVVATSKDGTKYYDHKLSKIEKGQLLTLLEGLSIPSADSSSPDAFSSLSGLSSMGESGDATKSHPAKIERETIESPVSEFKDKRLISILQTNASKVVDANGEPMVVYHGSTKGDFYSFDRNRHQTEDGIFFTNNLSLAEEYAEASFEFDEPKVYETFLNIKNPYVFDFDGMKYRNIKIESTIEKAESQKRDGVIAKNIIDTRFHDSKNIAPSSNFIVFEPHQIKSATENTGKFNSDSTDIRFQEIESLDNAIQELETQRKYEKQKETRYVNQAKSKAQAVEQLQKLSQKFNTPVVVVDSKRELPENLRYASRDRQFSGLYHKQTGKVYFILNEIRDADDATATFLHEVVSHKGIDGLMGEENAAKFYEAVFNSLPKKEQDLMLAVAGGSKIIAGDEAVARMAEGNVTPGMKQRVISAVRRFFREVLGCPLTISDNDIRYILWKSKNNLERANSVSKVFSVMSADKSTRGKIYGKGRPLMDDVNEIGLRYRIKKENPVATAHRVSGAKNAIKSAAIQVQEAIQDATIKVHLLQKEIEKRGGTVTPEINVYESLNHSESRTKAAMDKYDQQYIAPFVKIIANFGDRQINYDQVGDYMSAKHSIERHLSGINAMSDEQDGNWTMEVTTKIVEDFESKLSQEELTHFWDTWRKATREILDTAERSGRMSTAQKNKILANEWQYYVPLRGKDWDFEGVMNLQDVFYYDYSGSNRSKRTDRKISDLRAKGRTTKAYDPIATLQNMAHMEISLSQTNSVYRKLLRMVQKYSSMSDLFELKERWYIKAGEEWAQTDYRPDENLIKSSDRARKNKRELEIALKKATSDAEKMQISEAIDQAEEKIIVKRETPERGYKGDPPGAGEVIVMKDGIKYVVVLKDAEIAQAINQHVGSVQRWLSKYPGVITRFMSKMATSKNIAFMIPNFIRDIQHATMYNFVDSDGDAGAFLKYASTGWGSLHRYATGGAQPLTDTERGGLNILDTKDRKILVNKYGKKRVGDTLYDLFVINGGETGYVHILDPADYQRKLRKAAKMSASRLTAVNALPKGFKAINDGIDYMANMSENITRFATFMSQIDKGSTVFDAVSYAKNITVNFNRKGKYSKGIGSLSMFFNAGVQGAVNTYSLWGNKKGKSAKEIAAQREKLVGVLAILTAFGFGMSMALHAMLSAMIGDDDEEFTVSDYERRTNIIIPTGNGTYTKIPIPIIFRPWYSLGVMMHDWMVGHTDGGNVASEFARGIADAMLPVQIDVSIDPEKGGWQGFKAFIPSPIKPFAEIGYNSNFAGLPINKDSKYAPSGTPDSQMGMPYASSWAKWISETLNAIGGGNKFTAAGVDENGYAGISNLLDISPSSIEHIVSSYTGGVGKMINDTFKLLTSDSGDRIKIPVADRFYGKAYEKDPSREYYDLRRGIELVYRNNKQTKEHGIESAWYSPEEFEGKTTEYENYYKKLRHTEKRIRNIRERMKEVEFGSTQYESLDNQINRLQRQFIKQYDDQRN